MRKLTVALVVLVLLPLGMRCDRVPTKERPCLTCAVADDLTWYEVYDTLEVWVKPHRDTMYWHQVEIPETTITMKTDWQRRPGRWVCKVDTTFSGFTAYGNDYTKLHGRYYTFDTTWIPLAPVFVDTTSQKGVEP